MKLKKCQFNKLFQIKRIQIKRMRPNLTDKKVEGGWN
jgi:hypothetical protein